MEKYAIHAGISYFSPEGEKDLFLSKENNTFISGEICSSAASDGTEEVNTVFQVCREGKGRLFIDVDFPAYSGDWFIFIPSACYDGNRFTLIPEPPMKLFVVDFAPEDPLDPPVTMLELPSLNNGFNRQITDGSAPVLGIWKKNENEAIFLSFEQGTLLGNHGIEMEVTEEKSLKVRLSIPSCRRKAFPICKNLDEPVVLAPGMKIESSFQIRKYEVKDFAAFYRYFAEIRNKFPEQKEYRNTRSFSHAAEILMDHFNKDRWNKKWSFYGKSIKNNMRVDFGWVSFVELPAILAQGGEMELERVFSQLTGYFENAPRESGLFHPAVQERDNVLSYEHSFVQRSLPAYPRPWGYLRHQCESLLTCLKCLMILEEKGKKIPESWKKALEGLADALQEIWKKYGQLGFMVELETKEIICGNSDSGCTAPAALLLASKYLGRKDFYDTALKMGDFYFERLKKYGFTCGGPGDALLAPDSESAFAMLEMFTLLYEGTQDEKWLSAAEFSADYCSSWTPAVAWAFPANSLFDRMKIDCRGSVQANLQNQHGAPGPCTLSASALMRLYCYTGKERFLLLLQEIAHNCVQYISTKDHPIRCDGTGKVLEYGAICEKVFFQDYSRQAGDCPAVDGGWTESSVLLTITEDPGIFWDMTKDKVFVLDHVEASVSGSSMTVKNPLAYPVLVTCKVLDEKGKVPSLENGLFPRKAYKIITLDAGETKVFSAQELK
ncbi:MAG: hypothetical protein IKA79_06005 [Lentisphaeria bacterium]|nr:hypothetical protein [Lentisphaeria bacterium]